MCLSPGDGGNYDAFMTIAFHVEQDRLRITWKDCTRADTVENEGAILKMRE